MIDPLVTVVVPSYNRLELLRVTAASLLCQSEAECEFLFVDDCSDDQTWGFLTAIASDRRVRLLRKKEYEQRGCQVSRNLGLAAARGRYLMFLDSDDLLERDCLKDRLEFAGKHPEADVIVGNQAMFFEQRREAAWVNQLRPEVHELDRFLHLSNPSDAPWVNGGCLLKTQPLRRFQVCWRREYLWDDALFHIECLLAGMSVVWMPRTDTPDSWYRLHGTVQFGQELHSIRGNENIADMLLFLADQLAAAGHLSVCRSKLLLRSLFARSFLPLLDRQQFSNAKHILRRLDSSGYFERSSLRALLFYASCRELCAASEKLTYWTNRLCRRLLPELFHSDGSGGYGRLPVSAEYAVSLLSRLQSLEIPSDSRA